jgi:predicted PurR-regulated permease PerM
MMARLRAPEAGRGDAAPAKPAREAHRLTTLGFYGSVLVVAILAYKVAEPFLTEIGWAVVLAICLAPLQTRLARRLGRTGSAAGLIVMVALMLTVPLLLVAYVLVGQGPQLANTFKAYVDARGGPLGLVHAAWQWLHQRHFVLPSEEAVVQDFAKRLQEFATGAGQQAGRLVEQAVAFVFSLTITLCILFFMLRDGPQMASGVRRLLPFGPERNARLLALIHDIVATSVTSTLVICVLQGIVGGATLLLLGVPGALLWAGLMTILAVLPVGGAALVWAPAALWLALSGSFTRGLVLALVGVLILGNIDNVVRPLMLSGRSRMSTLMLIISLLGGVSAFGFIGFVLGPVVGAVLTGLVKTYALLPEVESETIPPPVSR